MDENETAPLPPENSPRPPPDRGELVPEIEWIRKAQSGDEDAFGLLVQSNYDRIFRHIAAVIRNNDDAKDLSQEVWITVWKQLKSFRSDAKFSTWVYSIATRRAIDHLRKRRRWFDRFIPFSTSNDSVLEPASSQPTPLQTSEQTERNESFERALASLPPKMRAVIALRELDGLSYDEIAHVLKCSPGTVMSRLFNARRLLVQKFKDLPCD